MSLKTHVGERFRKVCQLIDGAGRPALSVTPSSDKYGGDQAGLGQWIVPPVAGTVLNHAVTLAQMDCFAAIQLQDYFTTDYDIIVQRVGSVHSRRVVLEVLSHTGDLLR